MFKQTKGTGFSWSYRNRRYEYSDGSPVPQYVIDGFLETRLRTSSAQKNESTGVSAARKKIQITKKATVEVDTPAMDNRDDGRRNLTISVDAGDKATFNIDSRQFTINIQELIDTLEALR